LRVEPAKAGQQSSCSISFLFKLWEVFLFPVFAGAHLRQVLVDSMVDQQKTMLPGLIRPVARDGGGVLTFGLVAPFAGIMSTSHLTIGGPWKLCFSYKLVVPLNPSWDRITAPHLNNIFSLVLQRPLIWLHDPLLHIVKGKRPLKVSILVNASLF